MEKMTSATPLKKPKDLTLADCHDAIGLDHGLIGLHRAFPHLVSPYVSRWLAKHLKAPVKALPKAVHELHQYGKRNNDQDAVDLAKAIPDRVHAIAFHQRVMGKIGEHMATRANTGTN